MKFICPVTNIVVTCDTVFTNSNTSVSSLHPVLNLPLNQLNKLNHNDNRHHKVTEYETQLMFCAYLFHTGLVKYTLPLPPKSVPVELCHRFFSVVHTMANRGTSDIARNAPKFCINEQVGYQQLKTYLFLLEETLKFGAVSSQDSESKTDISDTLMEELEQRKKIRRQAKLLKTNRERNLKQLKLWALMHLQDSEDLELVTTIFDKPEKFGVQAVKKVRSICAVQLPETNETHMAKKDELDEWLKTVILRKLELNLALSMSEDEIAEINAELAEIENSYKIMMNGEEFVNHATEGAVKVTELLSMDKPEHTAAPSIAVPSSAPKREDYKNEMAYKIAVRKFSQMVDKL